MDPILAQESAELSSIGTLIVILFGVGFYFAVIVAVIVYRRGQRRWALWAGLSALVPIGSIVVPILALKEGSPEPVVLTEPCPGCGEHTGYAEHGRFDRASENLVPHPVTAIISGVVGVGVAIGAVLLAVSIWAGGDKSCSGGLCIEWENGAVIAGIGFLLFGLWLASLAGHWALAYTGADPADGVRYRCAGCKDRWVRFTDSGMVTA